MNTQYHERNVSFNKIPTQYIVHQTYTNTIFDFFKNIPRPQSTERTACLMQTALSFYGKLFY